MSSSILEGLHDDDIPFSIFVFAPNTVHFLHSIEWFDIVKSKNAKQINQLNLIHIQCKKLTSIQTKINISAANGRSGNKRRKTPRKEQNIQLIIIAAMTIYSIIF